MFVKKKLSAVQPVDYLSIILSAVQPTIYSVWSNIFAKQKIAIKALQAYSIQGSVWYFVEHEQ